MTITPTFRCEPPEPGSIADVVEQRIADVAAKITATVESALREMLTDGLLDAGWSLAESHEIGATSINVSVVKIPPHQGPPSGSWRVWGPYTPEQVQKMREAAGQLLSPSRWRTTNG